MLAALLASVVLLMGARNPFDYPLPHGWHAAYFEVNGPEYHQISRHYYYELLASHSCLTVDVHRYKDDRVVEYHCNT